MGIEIERKFLLSGDGWKNQVEGDVIRQGYLSSDHDRVVRVRTMNQDAFITIKSSTDGLFRNEWEYAIPLEDAEDMLERLCLKPLIEKVRYRIPYEGMIWEVDEFFGENAGLFIAEIELESVDQVFALPPWAGREVTDDPRYYNTNLMRNPYRIWKGQD
ncbi:CYTH domain-containing protein [Oxalobacter sp. OttesenSCG-928-P03]|nr:CYTH domain-containing protein [Oxalobacter sp. OttesenSCG-928-P03]